MSSILRKALWPLTVVAGMLLLMGAIGTATAPVAFADPGDVCAILGPFPGLEEDQNDLDSHDIEGKLLVDETYIFVIYSEDGPTGTALVTVEIDDEEGDADITSYYDNETGAHVEISGTDVVANIIQDDAATIDADVLDSLEAEFGFTLDDAVEGCGITGVGEVPDSFVIIDVTCEDPGRFEMTAYESLNLPNSITGEFLCVQDANVATLTAVPTTVESVPAPGNVSHSLLVVVLTDDEGNPAAPGQTVDWSTDRCRIDGLTEEEYEVNAPGVDDVSAAALFAGFSATTASTIETNLSGHAGLTGTSTSESFENDPAGPPPVRTIAAAILHCEGAAPGVANVVAELERTGADLRATATVTVVGPPAFITMTAAPNRLVCGEKATILITVTDAINQRVSDHTSVELITNFGGVIGGTGGTLGFPGTGPVNPLSSGAAETFGGVATAYLLTSTQHVGAYEVVAASGGSTLGGVFSTPVVTSQVTVTCTAGAAPGVTAPATGTGTISPPNTGDAGLAAASSSNAMLFVIAGAAAFVLAGLASYGYARR